MDRPEFPDALAYEDLRPGAALPEVEHLVDAAFLDAFCAATGDTNPWSRDGAAAFGRRVAPPSVATIFSTAILGNPGVDRPPGDVHARQSWETLRPILEGSRIRTSGVVTDRFEKKGRKWIEYEATSRDETGTVVAISRCTIVVKA